MNDLEIDLDHRDLGLSVIKQVEWALRIELTSALGVPLKVLSFEVTTNLLNSKEFAYDERN